jgi:pilus assembly protein Flp/PilA
MAIKKYPRESIMSNFIKGFVKDECGVTAVEYALIAGLITAGLLISVGGLVTKLTSVFAAIVAAI